MIFRKLIRLSFRQNVNYWQERNMSLLYRHFEISKDKAEYIALKHPVVKKLNNEDIEELIDTVYKLGFRKEILIEEPVLMSLLPVTLNFRYQVLTECAIEKISAGHLVKYLPLVKQKTVGELKRTGEINPSINIENRLASYMTQWPTSLTDLIYGDVNDCTLHTLRLRIVQRYLELVLDLSNEEFVRGLKTYPTIKHRPLAAINETLTILQSLIMMPPHKIKNNLFLVHSDPSNLKQIIFNFKSIAGIDIKEIIRMHPQIACKRYSTLVKNRKVLQEYGVSNEAQIRCFEIYTLGPDTIRDRLEKAKTIPEFNTFSKHPRFLKMILYKNTAMKRLTKLYDNNKKCLSLNILSGSTARYEAFEKAPGDRLGKGKDLIFCISEALENQYRSTDIRKSIKRHPFWINIPLVQVKYVHEKLSKQFSKEDIYCNCPILLYPWNKVKEILQSLNSKHKSVISCSEQIDISKLTKSQKLSLTLYLLEKNHYFTGNGVWTEDKSKTFKLENLPKSTVMQA